MKTIQPKQWTKFKEEFYKKFPDEDDKILDYIASYGIIYLVVNGFSNEEISYQLGETEDYIQSVCSEFLGFLGYKEPLEFSPLKQYKRTKEIIEIGNNPIREICERYLEIEKKVEDYYSRN